MILQVGSQKLQLLQDEARKSFPIEACALLFGKRTTGKTVLDWVVITPNVLKSHVRFEIDPKTFYEAFKQAEEAGLEFVGFFHSHPAPSNPSSFDLEFMRLWGDAIWLILSTTDSTIAAFQMSDGKVQKMIVKTNKP